jgi:hypothetical protein
MRLSDWLESQDRAPNRAYAVTDLSERAERPAELLPYLAALLSDAKIDPSHVDRIAAALGFEDVRTRLVPGGPAVRRGEFGETIAAAILEEIEGWRVPIPKLRYQIDPTQTQPGTDLLAVQMDGPAIVGLHFAESKLRSGADNRAAVAAHGQLAEDQKRGFADILVFVLARLLERNSELADPLERYLAGRSPGDRGTYGIFLTFDETAWGESVLDALDAETELLDPLAVRITRLRDLRGLADAVCASAGIPFVDNDD